MLFIIPKKHKCGEILGERKVPVNEKIIGYEKGYPVDYCPACKVYKFNEYESENPEVIGDIVTNLQAQQNLKTNHSIYSISVVNKLEKSLA